MINHYVSRCISENWASADDHLVAVVDFQKCAIERLTAEDTFSLSGVLSSNSEQFFNQAFETNLGRFLRSNVETGYRTIRDRSVYSSIRLYMNYQIERLLMVQNQNYIPRIVNVENFDICELLRADESLFDIGGLKTNLFVGLPESGFFLLPLATSNSEKYGVAFCFPLTPHFLLIKTLKSEGVLTENLNLAHVSNFSFSYPGGSSRVAIPSEMLSSHGDQVVCQELSKVRENNGVVWNDLVKLRSLLEEKERLIEQGIAH